MLGIREASGVHDFPSNCFGSQCREFSKGNLSVLFFRNFPVANNLMNKRGGESIKIFRGQFFVSQCRKCS